MADPEQRQVAETSGRLEFPQLIGMAKKIVESIGLSGRPSKGEMLQAIGMQSPKYSLWLVTG
ncbi:hypothetical protein [Salinicola sp.]|uniref:hypothetical protein n=1 Tax=Salinicola sp. TaxID=1978524 RepID=UPI0025E792DB|nr:hypothetical protein [Salinicola sp.]